MLYRYLLLVLMTPFLVQCDNWLKGTYGQSEEYFIESSADGSGTVYSSITVNTNSTTTLYSIKRKSAGDYVDNSVVSWGTTGTVGSLLIIGNGKSASFIAGATPGIGTLFISSGGKTLSQIDVIVVASTADDITISNLQTSNIGSSYFDISVDFTGDQNTDATLNLYYCNDTDSSGCDPLAGTMVAMSRGASDFTASVSSLTTPNDPGDTLNIKVVATDGDGVTGSPLTTTVTLINILISRTDFETDAAFSFVALEVDWARKLAYMGTRQTGQCFKVVDFSNELAPVVVQTIGTGTTPASTGNNCLGLKLFSGNTKLAITSDSGQTVDVWDLGADPSLYTYTRLASIATTRPKQIAGIDESGGANSIKIYVGRRAGVKRLNFNSGTSALTSDWDTGGLTDDHNGSVWSSLGYMFTGGPANAAPIEYFDSTGTLLNSFNLDNGGASGTWTGSVSDDGKMIFMGGWVSGFLNYTLGGSPFEFAVTKRVDNISVYRGSTYYEDGTDKFFVGSSATRTFDFYNVTDINNPLWQYEIIMWQGTGEMYGVKADSVSRRIIGVTNRGEFYILDMDKLDLSTTLSLTQPTAF